MDEATLKSLLRQVRRGKVSVPDAVARLRDLPVADLGFASIDRHRSLRQGFPEAVFGESKTVDQIAGIVSEMLGHGPPVLVTRLSPEKAEELARALPEGRYHPLARMFVVERRVPNQADRAGGRLAITGEKPPCSMCRARMQEFAARNDCTVEYSYEGPDGTGEFRSERGNSTWTHEGQNVTHVSRDPNRYPATPTTGVPVRGPGDAGRQVPVPGSTQ